MLFQQDWKFFQNVTPRVGPLVAPLEAYTKNKFIPDLLWGKNNAVTDALHHCTTWGVKQGGIEIP